MPMIIYRHEILLIKSQTTQCTVTIAMGLYEPFDLELSTNISLFNKQITILSTCAENNSPH